MHPDHENEQIRRKLQNLENGNYTRGFDRAAAWARLEQRLPVSRHRRFHLFPYAAVAAAALLLAFFVLRPDQGTHQPAVAASCKDPWPISSAKLFPDKVTAAIPSAPVPTAPAALPKPHVHPPAVAPAPLPQETPSRQEPLTAATPAPPPPREKVYHINEIIEDIPAREEEEKGFFASIMKLKPIQEPAGETVVQTRSSRFRFIHKN